MEVKKCTQLPNELWTIILVQISASWEERIKLARVCKQWREIIYYYQWSDTLTITENKTNQFPPFYNIKTLRIIQDCTLDLLKKINETYKLITNIEFGMFSTKPPKNKDEILLFLKNEMKTIQNVQIGTAFSWISKENIHCLSNLKHCNLSNCISIDGEDFKYFCNFKSLNISLKQSNPKEDLVKDDHLQYLENIKELNLSNRSWIFDNGLRQLKKIKVLTINNCKVNGNSFSSLKDHLTHLSYHRCDNIHLNNYSYLSSLISIDLSYSTINNDCLEYFYNIKCITLDYCTGISGLGLRYLTNVEKLSLVACNQLVDNSIRNINPSVSYLNLRNCSKLTDLSIDFLLSDNNHFKIVNLNSCPKITKSAVEKSKNSKLKIISDFDLIYSFRKS